MDGLDEVVDDATLPLRDLVMLGIVEMLGMDGKEGRDGIEALAFNENIDEARDETEPFR